MKNKLTIDLTEHNKRILEKIKTERNLPYGNTINTLIDTFGEMPEKVKKDLLSLIKIRIKSLIKEMNEAEVFRTEDLVEQTQTYIDIATFFNDGKQISIQSIKEEPTLKKYQIKDGFLICPDDWIVLNLEKAGTMMYAGVVECCNSENFGIKYFGERIPHFVFFTDIKYRAEYNNYYSDYIKMLCVQKWPNFQKVIESQVEPIFDPERLGYLINDDEWTEAPSIGIFSIYEQDDPTYVPGYEPPMGARIIRTKTK